MGVLNCDRENCGGIMCRRHSPDYGYLCEGCFSELVNRGPDVRISDFMASDKKSTFVPYSQYSVIFPVVEVGP